MGRRKRQGRGRLSSIDLLPDEAAPDVQWAVDELLANKRPQSEILAEFNTRLGDLGIEPVSSSAFNRHSVRLAALTRKMTETQNVTDAIAARMGPDKADNLTVGLVTLLKQSIFELRETGEIDAESLMFLAKSTQALVSAQKQSADLRRAQQAEIETRLKQAAKAVEAVGKERGLTPETIEKISAGILGVTA